MGDCLVLLDEITGYKVFRLSQHIEQFVEYNGIYVHPKMLEVNKTTGEPYAENWIKLNADINKLCQEDAEFKQVYEYKMKQLDEEMKKC